jgi:hypothetical protein
VAVGDFGQDFAAQPLGPEQLLLLLAGWAEAAAAAGEGDQDAPAARAAPEPGEAVLEQPAAQELPQHPLDHRPQRPVAPGEALGPDPQQLLEVALHEPVERRLTRTPRLVDPATDLHAQTQAGGRGAGGKGGGLWRSGLPKTDAVWPGHRPSKVREPATTGQGCAAGARLPVGRRTADPPGAASSRCQAVPCPSSPSNGAEAARTDSS